MKKVIKLTESDLARIVRRVIKEQEDQAQAQPQPQTQNQGLEVGPYFTDNDRRTYKLPGITNQNALDTFLTWTTGEYASDIVKQLQDLKLQGVGKLAVSAAEVSKSQNSPEGYTKTGNMVSMMNGTIRELLRLSAMMSLTESSPNLERTLTANFNKNFTKPYQGFFSTITTDYPNFWQVFKTILTQQRAKI